jgi:putative spermidine/putrescine transport system ATP-binding protein
MLDADAASGEPGAIREAVYAGMVTRYYVELEAGGELQVVEQNLETSSPDLSAAKGQRVRLEWSPESVFEIQSQSKEDE